MTQKSKQLDLKKIMFSELLNGLEVQGLYSLSTPGIAKLTNGELCNLNLSLNAADDLVVIGGTVDFLGEFDCGRCLKPFKQKVHNQVSTEAECDEVFFDLESVLEEELLSDIAITSICDVECKGLCDKCGTDLNALKCKCGH